jgi:hypothetical protein
MSDHGRLLAVVHADRRGTTRIITGGVRGKYLDRYRQGTNVVLLEPDVAAKFPTSSSVNEALRRLVSQRGG